MICVSPSGVLAQPDAVPRLRAEFAETGCAMLPGFLAPPLLEIIMRRLETARFETANEVASKTGRIFGNTLKLSQSEPGLVALNFALNRPELFELAREIGNTPPLRNFLGRLHRTTAGSDQHIDWHDDNVEFSDPGPRYKPERRSARGWLVPDARCRPADHERN